MITLSSIAQQTATTTDGKVVVLYENGTWKYKQTNKAKLEGIWKEKYVYDDGEKYPSGSNARELYINFNNGTVNIIEYTPSSIKEKI